jgi:hypothetical protein
MPRSFSANAANKYKMNGSAGVLQALAKCAKTLRVRVRRCGVQESDHRHPRLLPPRRDQPPSRAAEKRDELASLSFDHLVGGRE